MELKTINEYRARQRRMCILQYHFPGSVLLQTGNLPVSIGRDEETGQLLLLVSHRVSLWDLGCGWSWGFWCCWHFGEQLNTHTGKCLCVGVLESDTECARMRVYVCVCIPPSALSGTSTRDKNMGANSAASIASLSHNFFSPEPSALVSQWLVVPCSTLTSQCARAF